MSGLSSLYPLLPVDPGPASIPTLRGQERPLPCPRCQRPPGGPGGTDHDQPGLQRSRCQEQACKRPCQALTGTLWDGRQRSLAPGRLPPLLLCLACASRRMARELGGQGRTRERWGGWLRHPVGSDEPDGHLTGPVAADALSRIAGHQGQASQGGPTR